MEIGTCLGLELVKDRETGRRLIRATAEQKRGKSETKIVHDMAIDEAEDMIAYLRELIGEARHK